MADIDAFTEEDNEVSQFTIRDVTVVETEEAEGETTTVLSEKGYEIIPDVTVVGTEDAEGGSFPDLPLEDYGVIPDGDHEVVTATDVIDEEAFFEHDLHPKDNYDGWSLTTGMTQAVPEQDLQQGNEEVNTTDVLRVKTETLDDNYEWHLVQGRHDSIDEVTPGTGEVEHEEVSLEQRKIHDNEANPSEVATTGITYSEYITGNNLEQEHMDEESDDLMIPATTIAEKEEACPDEDLHHDDNKINSDGVVMTAKLTEEEACYEDNYHQEVEEVETDGVAMTAESTEEEGCYEDNHHQEFEEVKTVITSEVMNKDALTGHPVDENEEDQGDEDGEPDASAIADESAEDGEPDNSADFDESAESLFAGEADGEPNASAEVDESTESIFPAFPIDMSIVKTEPEDGEDGSGFIADDPVQRIKGPDESEPKSEEFSEDIDLKDTGNGDGTLGEAEDGATNMDSQQTESTAESPRADQESAVKSVHCFAFVDHEGNISNRPSDPMSPDTNVAMEPSEDEEHYAEITITRTGKVRKRGKIHRCDTCEITFPCLRDLKKHMKIHAVAKPNTRSTIPTSPTNIAMGPPADEDLYAEITLTKTGRVRKRGVIHRCDTCEITFPCRRDLKKHLKIHAVEKPYNCSFCGKAFRQPSYLNRHMLVHRGRKQYHCLVCEEAAVQHSNSEVKQVPEPYKCGLCDNVFTHYCEVKQHLSVHSLLKSYKCDECDEVFTKPRDLKRHQEEHLPSYKPYRCNICDKTFTRSIHLKHHETVHSGIKPYKCNECPKTFNRPCDLKNHKASHKGTLPHQCNFCGKAFTFMSHLKQHRTIHMGVRPHVCETCGKGFNRASDLRRHKAVHSGDLPHKCETCGKAFIRQNDLERHQRGHSGVKPYQCNLCPKAFIQPSDLKRHLMVHSGHKPYRCEICGKAFAQRYNVRLHMPVHARKAARKGLVPVVTFKAM